MWIGRAHTTIIIFQCYFLVLINKSHWRFTVNYSVYIDHYFRLLEVTMCENSTTGELNALHMKLCKMEASANKEGYGPGCRERLRRCATTLVTSRRGRKGGGGNSRRRLVRTPFPFVTTSLPSRLQPVVVPITIVPVPVESLWLVNLQIPQSIRWLILDSLSESHGAVIEWQRTHRRWWTFHWWARETIRNIEMWETCMTIKKIEKEQRKQGHENVFFIVILKDILCCDLIKREHCFLNGIVITI